MRMEPLHVGLLAAGILVAVLGYWLLARDSISAAPILLLLAYLLLIPVGLALPARGEQKGDRDRSG